MPGGPGWPAARPTCTADHVRSLREHLITLCCHVLTHARGTTSRVRKVAAPSLAATHRHRLDAR